MTEPLGGPVYWLPFVIGFVIAYLVGSIPFGLLLTRARRAGDLKTIGSGNIGATNVLRTGRRGLALATLFLDALKGALPVWAAWRFFGPDMAAVAGLGAVLGHCFPLWLGFRGGKGVATAAGVALALTPSAFLIVLALFALTVALTRYVSLGSILAALVLIPIAWALGSVQAAQLYVLIALIILLKHTGNIRRLLRGEESKLSLGGRAG
jgi:glycerol-3-phosphate acyltransferase PlsY